MSFLAPLFLLGGMAIAAPLLFHLIRRNTKEKFTFSSLMFLRADPPTVTRKSKLEDILLLLVRCALLIVLALAFSRPFIRQSVLPPHDPTAGRHVVLLVDQSASMRRTGVWKKTLAQAEATLKALKPNDTLAVLAFGDGTQPLVTFEQWRKLPEADRLPVARRALTALQPGWEGTHLGNALSTAADLLAEQPVNAPRQIVVITDRQAGSRLDGLQGADWPEHLQMTLHTIAPAAPGNAGLQLAPGRGADKDASTRVRVTNAADATREQFTLVWQQANQAPSTNAVPVYVPAGQTRTLTAPPRPAGDEWRLMLRGDTEGFDDTLYLAPELPEPVRIHYVGSEAADDTKQMRFFLERVFSKTRTQHVTVLAHDPGALTGQLAHPDDRLLILTQPMPAAGLERVRAFCQSGHSTLLVLPDTEMTGTLSALAGGGPVPVAEAVVDRYALLTQLDFEHPVLAPFNEPRFSDFTKIHFWKHRRIDPLRLPGARVLARFDDGDPALLHLRLGAGHLFVLTAGWQKADSELALSSKFVPLLYSMMEMGAPVGTVKAANRVGQKVALPGENTTDREVSGPGGIVPIAAGRGDFHADQPGIFTLEGPRPAVFAVNLDPRESRTEPLEMERLTALKLPFALNSKEKAEIVQKREQTALDEQLEKSQKIWRWLIVAAIVLVILETWLGGWLWRKPAPETATEQAT